MYHCIVCVANCRFRCCVLLVSWFISAVMLCRLFDAVIVTDIWFVVGDVRSGRFHLHKGEDPVDSELLAYLRVFHMTQGSNVISLPSVTCSVETYIVSLACVLRVMAP